MRAHTRDAESFCDGGWSMPSIVHLPHLLNRHIRPTALVDALGLRGFDTRLLPLPDQLAFRLGHHPPPHLWSKAGSRTVRAALLASRSWTRFSTSRVGRPK